MSSSETKETSGKDSSMFWVYFIKSLFGPDNRSNTRKSIFPFLVLGDFIRIKFVLSYRTFGKLLKIMSKTIRE